MRIGPLKTIDHLLQPTLRLPKTSESVKSMALIATVTLAEIITNNIRIHGETTLQGSQLQNNRIGTTTQRCMMRSSGCTFSE